MSHLSIALAKLLPRAPKTRLPSFCCQELDIGLLGVWLHQPCRANLNLLEHVELRTVHFFERLVKAPGSAYRLFRDAPCEFTIASISLTSCQRRHRPATAASASLRRCGCCCCCCSRCCVCTCSGWRAQKDVQSVFTSLLALSFWSSVSPFSFLTFCLLGWTRGLSDPVTVASLFGCSSGCSPDWAPSSGVAHAGSVVD